MTLAEIDALPSFAVLGPGFGGEPFLLLAPLRPDPGGDDLVFVRFEQRVDEALRFRAERTPVELELGWEGAPLAAALDGAGYLAAVARIRASIEAGEVYQVNLTTRARLPALPGARLFAALCADGVPRFAAWARFPDGAELVSASPELLFEIAGTRIRSEPMKGTARPEEADALAASEKDRAELAMITDLVRNDLTPICLPRRVRVASARRLLRLPYAVQAVSDVEGELRPGVGPLDALAALHPAGSVTGAPKPAALAMIGDLEPTPRGPYCGVLLHGHAGSALASLLIRTAFREGPGWTYGVGGGIVHDSDPAREWAEIETKLGALGCVTRS